MSHEVLRERRESSGIFLRISLRSSLKALRKALLNWEGFVRGLIRIPQLRERADIGFHQIKARDKNSREGCAPLKPLRFSACSARG